MRRRCVAAVVAALGLAASVPSEGLAGDIGSLEGAALDARWRADAAALRAERRRLEALTADIEQAGELWGLDEETPLSPEQRDRALDLLARVLDYEIALDGLSAFHFNFWRLNIATEPRRHARHFVLAFTAYCHKLLLGLTLIERTLGKRQFEKLLDEGSPAHGLPPGAYGRLKWHVVHVEKMTVLFAARQYHKFLRRTLYGRLARTPLVVFVLSESNRAYRALKAGLREEGARLFAGNGFDILKDEAHQRWFPVQAGVAGWMGDTRVRRRDGSGLISAEQIAEASRQSAPGDIILERRNWYVSNLGLPGFWPHSALWLGTPDELARRFDADPEVTAHFGMPFTHYLKKTHPTHWLLYASNDSEGHPHRLLEAVSEGVVFTSAEHSLAADYAAALRPARTPTEVARSIERAFAFVGRPYDFDFDFYTDRELVCSEVVFKAWEAAEGFRGIEWELQKVAGRMTLPPNAMAAQFDREHDTPDRPLDFVWFLDGREETGDAHFADLEAFRQSHARPKWDIRQK